MGTLPTAKVEIGFASAPDDPVQVWTDVSADVEWQSPITCNRGRRDELANVEPGRLSLTLDNSSGNYTFANATGAHYPNVQPRKRIRVSVSADGGATYRVRFDGYVDGWPVAWRDGVTERALVGITATDRLARFGRLRKLRDAIHEQIGTATAAVDGARFDTALFDTDVFGAPVGWLYGLQEQSGATTAGDVSGAAGRPTLTLTQTGAEGTVEFGTAGIMPEGTAVKFTPASAGNGLTLGSTTPIQYMGAESTLFAQFAWTGSTSVQVVQVGASPADRVTIAATPTTVTATFTPATGSAATATKTYATGDNRPHMAVVTVAGTTISLYIDEESAATATLPAGLGNTQGVTIGTLTSADPVQVAWVGYAARAFTATEAAALGMLGSGGSERSDLRVARILGWLGLATDLTTETGASDVAYQATGGNEALTLINAVHDVEGGVFFPSGSGLVNHSRTHRYDRGSSASIAAEDIDPDNLAVGVDSSRLVNSWRVSRPAGATYLARNEASIAAYTEMTASDATLYAATDNDLRAAADWRVGKYGDIYPHIPSVTLDLLTHDAAFAAMILGLEIGDRITLTGLPDTAPSTTVDLFVEGVADVVGARDWRVTLSTSPRMAFEVAYFDTALFDTASFVY